MNIAIVGAGLSGLQAASKVHQLGHSVTVFEANDYVGGHIQTLRVPFTQDNAQHEAIVDMGVFMFDPILIHPYLQSLIKDKNLALTEIPLDFTVDIRHTKKLDKFCWTTSGFEKSRLRGLQIFLHTMEHHLKQYGWAHSTQYLYAAWELARFNRLLPALASYPQFSTLSIGDFIKQYGFSDRLVETWILPQMLCWWGATRDTVLNNSIQVLADSLYKVSQQPQYTLTQGLDQLILLLSTPIQDFIKKATPVQAITRSSDNVIVHAGNQEHTFDALVLATPPNVALKILGSQNPVEKTILENYTTTTTTVHLHTDESWLPKQERWATINLIQDSRGDFCTFWIGKLHPLAPKLFLTWGDKLKVAPATEKTIKTTQFLRTLPTLGSMHSSDTIHSIQGQNRTWYCGAHVDALNHADSPAQSLWADNALKSGLQAAEAIHQWSLL